ncbi:glycosyltransferase [Olivibacter domesticus]|uniref:Glycosyltransferase, catalytic subunit of cellulose synthase and poly-beta-1,6-N-acetylglucosamine synthase n=1 Tax=Olivibacter domesticus TaxID=407022 RepID=A0A1H7XIB2_OLID1|nr:glycosyltransferase [Olivibacter domesticus]SEM33642.1 Glycosyltransferase, catalytic subunit of cellulose synthase and poly-beta-1,6-N-acetylglucosamine synthase [Olivibacter domesticus]
MLFFSIIVPLYNRPQEIDELLFTLVQQDYKHFEVLIIEDGSTLDAKNIVENYKDRLNLYYYVKDNEGQGFARNFGFERAKGDYFVVFDSDCLIPFDYLTKVDQYLTAHSLDAYGGPDAAHESFTPVQKAISYSMTSPLTTGGIRGNTQHIGQFHPRSFNMGVSREVWQSVGGYKLTRLGEDIEYSIRIHKAGFKIGLIPNAIVYHKRRTDFIQFYRQLHFFGRARINIYKHFPTELKLVHFFPAFFTIFLAITIALNLLESFFLVRFPVVTQWCNFVLGLYIFLLFFHGWYKTKTIKVAFLGVIAAFIQLTAYGVGFMQDFWRKVIN